MVDFHNRNKINSFFFGVHTNKLIVTRGHGSRANGGQFNTNHDLIARLENSATRDITCFVLSWSELAART